MSTHITITAVSSISVAYEASAYHGGWVKISIADASGGRHIVSLEVGGPIAIHGADKLLMQSLAAQPAEPMVVDGGTFGEERREYFL